MKKSVDLALTSSYDYFLPKELIAQDPAYPRDSSKLLLVEKDSFKLEHKVFSDITDYLSPGDLLVLNDTRVLPARLEGVKKHGSAKVEIFFLRPSENVSQSWLALVRPGRKLPNGTIVLLGDNEIVIGERLEDGLRLVHFTDDISPINIIHKLGHTPLPHYITHTHAESERYQTVYSRFDKENSVAAPTAGLHFTQELLDRLAEKGIKRTFVTLQVGLGTFRPVKAENIKEHVMHSELCEVTEETARMIEETKNNGKRVIAVGTTVVRTLESFASQYGSVRPGILDTRLFISPGYSFKVIDALITNFHLPKSTLLMLVSAFGGYDTMMSAYTDAVKNSYRFFSFGDAMFIR